MLMPDRPTGAKRKNCTWHEGCHKLATENSRFCVVHLNMTIGLMKATRYLTPLENEVRWFYKSTVRARNWHNY